MTDLDLQYEMFRELRALPPERREARLAELERGDARLAGRLRRLLEADTRCVPGLEGADDDTRPAGGSAAPSSLPQAIGPYRILERLGSGSTGIVFRARQDAPRREVALKVLRPGVQDSTAAARFRREIECLGSLDHDGIAKIFAAGTCDLGFGELPYFAMELVRGEAIASAVRGLELTAICRVVADACDAVQHAHEHGVIHRDLKPSNILVESRDDKLRVRVLDFGIARLVRDTEAEAASLATRTGSLIGTLAYMSPEQAKGQTVDVRSDVYALGVLLFECVAQQLPIDVRGVPVTRAIHKIAHQGATRLGSTASVPRDLERIAATALAREPDDRYPSARALGEDLRRFAAGQPIVARTPGVVQRARSFVRRNRAAVATFAAILLALLGALTIFAQLARQNRELAQRESRAKLEMRELLYRSEIAVAANELMTPSGTTRARAIVDRWREEDPDATLRDWDWAYLWSECHPDALRIASPASHRVRALASRAEGAETDVLVYGTAGLQHVDASGARLADMLQPRGAPYSPTCAFSRDASLLAVAHAGGGISVLDTRTGQVRQTVRTPSRALALTFAGRTHLGYRTNEQRNELHVFPLGEAGGARTLRLPPRQDSPGDRILCSAIDPESRRVAIAEPERLAVLDFASGELLFALEGAQRFSTALRWSPDGRHLATGDRKGTLRVYRCPLERDGTALEMVRRTEHGAEITDLAWSADGQRVASASADHGVRISDLSRPSSPSLLRGHDHVVTALCFTPAAAGQPTERLVSADRGGAVYLWSSNPSTSSTTVTLVPKQADDYVLTWPDADRVSASANLDSWQWHRAGGGTERCIRAFPSPPAMPGLRIRLERAGGGHGNRIRIEEGGNTRFCPLPEQGLRDVALHDTLPYAILVFWYDTFVLDIRKATLRKVAGVRAVHRASLQRGGKLAALAGEGDVFVVRLPDAELVARPPAPRSGRVFADWSPDGARLAIQGDDSKLRVWHVSDRREGATKASGAAGRGVSWSPDGARIAGVARDRTLRLYDSASLRETLRIRLSEIPQDVRWSPDGERLAVLLLDGRVRVLDASRGLAELEKDEKDKQDR